MLILTGCHVTRESSLLTHVESSGLTPWYRGRSLARLFLIFLIFVQGQISVHIFAQKRSCCVFLSFKYFATHVKNVNERLTELN